MSSSTAALFAAGASLYAQPAAPAPTTEATVLKRSYTNIKNNITKAADRMPEDQYGFKASPDIRTFGALIAHIADVQGRTCARIAGGGSNRAAQRRNHDSESRPGRGALKGVVRHRAIRIFNALTPPPPPPPDDDAGKMVPSGRGGATSSKFATLWGLIIGHGNEEYGYLAVYMRVKGVVPPSSEPRP